MKYLPGNAQSLGARNEQQDWFGFSDTRDEGFVAHAGFLALVADGMGGMQEGGKASRLAVRVFLAEYHAKAAGESISDALIRCLKAANVAVAELNRGATGSEMTGTTIAAAVVHDDTVQWASAGDSAIYLVRGGRLTRLNSTHDYGAVLDGLVAEGKLPLEEAQIHPDRDALTSFVGVPDLSDVDTSARPIPIEKGDRLLLCTDGVYKTLDESEIVRELDGPPQAACERLIAGVAAKERLQQDNATVLMVELQRELAVPQSVASRPAPRATRIGVWKLATFAVIIAVFVTAWLVSSSPVQGTPAPAEMAQKPGDYTGPVAPIEKAAAE